MLALPFQGKAGLFYEHLSTGVAMTRSGARIRMGRKEELPVKLMTLAVFHTLPPGEDPLLPGT